MIVDWFAIYVGGLVVMAVISQAGATANRMGAKAVGIGLIIALLWPVIIAMIALAVLFSDRKTS